MNVLAGRQKQGNRKSKFKIPQVVHKNVCPSSEACWKIGHVHSNLPNVTHVATKVNMVLKRLVVLTWVHDNGELV